MPPWSSIEVNKRFDGTSCLRPRYRIGYCLHLQGKICSQFTLLLLNIHSSFLKMEAECSWNDIYISGSLPREPPTGYRKPVSRKQLDKQDFHGNQQMQHILLRAVFSLGSAWIRAFPWQPAENNMTSSPSDIDKDGREWPSWDTAEQILEVQLSFRIKHVSSCITCINKVVIKKTSTHCYINPSSTQLQSWSPVPSNSRRQQKIRWNTRRATADWMTSTKKK
jgi:hypothetical protein